METFDDVYFRKLAKQIMFDLSDEEVVELQDEFKVLVSQMNLLEKIDTSDVEPMVYPFEMETSFIREDEVSDVLSMEEALMNAKTVTEGHVLVPKVVK